MKPDTIRKEARDLKPGDVLWPTMREVAWAGQTVHTPAGKITVELHGPGPRGRSGGDWRRGTMVSVVKP